VFVANVANALDEGLGGHHITALAQHRLLHDTKDEA